MAFNSNLLGTQWLNSNSLRKYPIIDDATCQDVTGSFTIPNDFIVDLLIPISLAGTLDPDGFYISDLAIFGQGVVITISYWNDGASPATMSSGKNVVGTVSVSATHVENSSYFIHGSGEFTDSVGRITIGKLDTILSYGGAYSFALAAARLVSTTIRPDVKGISSIRLVNGSDISDPIYGDIELVAGTNVLLEVSGDQITINAIDGLNLTTSCGCADTSDVSDIPCIKTINGVAPSTNGNITITSTECVSVTSTIGGLYINDQCSTPCCTSAEINKLLEDQTQLNVDIRTQSVTLQQLDGKLSELSALTNAINSTGFLLS